MTAASQLQISQVNSNMSRGLTNSGLRLLKRLFDSPGQDIGEQLVISTKHCSSSSQNNEASQDITRSANTPQLAPQDQVARQENPEIVWELYRMDDNGNVVTMNIYANKEEASELMRMYEQRGHKQCYFIRPITN